MYINNVCILIEFSELTNDHLAVVILRDLNCDTVYKIKAAGTIDNGTTLVGPFDNFTPLVSGPCKAVVLHKGKMKEIFISLHTKLEFMNSLHHLK